MRFKKSLPKVEGERSSGDLARQARERLWDNSKSVIGVQNRIQNPPRQQRKNVLAQVVGWEKPDPNHNMATTKRTPTQCHLR
jgi:hypothetical protein